MYLMTQIAKGCFDNDRCPKAAFDPLPEFARDEGLCYTDRREFTLLKERGF